MLQVQMPCGKGSVNEHPNWCSHFKHCVCVVVRGADSRCILQEEVEQWGRSL